MSPQRPDAAVAAKAAVQYGNATYSQLIESGLTDTAIAWRVRRGRLYRVHPQVYAVGHPPRLPLERAAAAVLFADHHLIAWRTPTCGPAPRPLASTSGR